MQNRGLIWLVMAVLAVQVYTMKQIGSIRSSQQHLQSNINSQLNHLQSRLSSTESQLAALRRANEWVLDIRQHVEPGATCTTGRVALDWSFRELDPDSSVALYVRRAGEAEWAPAPTSATGPLSYRSTFDVQGTVRSEPMIEIGRSGRGSSSTRAEQTATKPAPAPDTYEYRIVARSGSGERSTETRSVNLAKLFVVWPRISVSVEEKNRYAVRLYVDPRSDASQKCLSAKAAAVRGYAGQEKVVDQALEPFVDGRQATLTPGQPLHKLEIWIQYDSGHEEIHTIQL